MTYDFRKFLRNILNELFFDVVCADKNACIENFEFGYTILLCNYVLVFCLLLNFNTIPAVYELAAFADNRQ